MAATYFRTLDDGRKAFYPHGMYGLSGYIAPPEAEARLLARAKGLHLFVCVACIWIALAVGSWIGELDATGLLALIGALAAASWLAASVVFWPLTRRLGRVAVRNTPLAHWRALGSRAHPAYLALCLGLSAVLATRGLLIWRLEHDPKGLVIAGVITAIGLVPHAFAAQGWWIERRRPLDRP